MPEDEGLADLRSQLDAMNEVAPSKDDTDLDSGDEPQSPSGPAKEPEEIPEDPEKATAPDQEPESPEGEPPEPPEPPDELSEEEKLQAFRQQLEDTLAARYAAPSEEAPPPKPAKEEPPPKPEPSPEPQDQDLTKEVDFIGDDDLSEILDSKESLNKLLNRVRFEALSLGQRLGTETVLRSIPEIVKRNVETQVTIQRMRDEFFSRNEDLSPYKRVVAECFQEIAAANPDQPMEKLLGETEKLSRQRLQLHRKVMLDTSKSPEKKPTFERTPRGKKSKPKGELSGLAKELQEMIELTD